MSALNSNLGAKGADPLFDRAPAGFDRLPGLKIVFEKTATAIGAELAELCRFKSAPSAAEIVKDGTFGLAERNEGSLGLVLRCLKTDARAYMVFDREFVDFVAHRAFGGSDDVSPIQASRGPEKYFSGSERGLMRRLAETAAAGLDAALAGIVETEYCIDRIEQFADSATLGKRDLEVVTGFLRFQGSPYSATCCLALSQTLIQLARQKLSEPAVDDEPAADPKWIKDLRFGVSTARVGLNGILEEVEVTLGDLAHLHVGSVLELSGAKMGKVLLESAGQKLFWCKVDQSEGKYNLEVEEPYQEDDIEIMLPSSA